MKPIKSPNKVIMSPAGIFNEYDFKAIVRRGILFITPLIALYLTPIIASISSSVAAGTFVFTTAIFIPGPLVVGACILYVLNRITDALNRFTKDNTYIVSELK
jgi:hypothetical protein